MKRILTCLFALLSLAAHATGSGGFLFVTFTTESSKDGEQIYFALSRDGLHWDALNGAKPVLVSKVGEKGVRDPHILKGEDGVYRVLATDLSIFHDSDWGRAVRKGSKSLVIWESKDLVKWSAPRLVEVAAKDAGCTWAPECVYDPEKREYLVFWASTSAKDDYGKQRIWGSWTKDFRLFGAPFVYIEGGSHLIDTTIIREGDRYYRFTKDGAPNAVTMESSDSVTGDWSPVEGFTLNGLAGFEGPTCFRLEEGKGGKPSKWCLLMDAFARKQGYKPFVTEDLSSGQFAPKDGVSFPFLFRHGSVVAIDEAEYVRLDKELGADAK